MISGRLRSSSKSSQRSKKDKNVNYLVWSDGEIKRFGTRSRSLSQNGRIVKSRSGLPQKNATTESAKSWSLVEESNKDVNDWDSASITKKGDFQIFLNIGGRHFIIRYSTLKYRCPTSFLTEFAAQTHEERLENCDGYIVQSQEYFFERSGLAFECIYDFLTTGHIHRPAFICRERIFREIEFWKIGSGFFAPCCMLLEDESDEDDGPGMESSVEYVDEFDNIRYGQIRRSIWFLMEEPSSSTLAKVFALASISMIIISVTAMILGSLPELQSAPEPHDNNTLLIKHDHELRQTAFFDYVEMVCIIWFSIEYIVRFIVCTRKCQFVFQPLNMIDSLSIIPFFIEIAFNLAGLGANKIGDFRGIAMIMRVIRVMRVARVFKLARYSNGLKSFGVTVKTSLPELSMLTLFLVTAIIFFSTLMYFAERDEPDTKFRSIPHAGWWCIVTMTTVGYGDFTPKTLFGRIIASCASISGVLVLAFPITMIVENFSKTYDTEKNELKTVQRKRRMAKAYA